MKNVHSFYFWNGWGMDEMMVPNSQDGSLAYGGCVRDLDHRSMTSFSLRVMIIRQDSMKKLGSKCGRKQKLESTYGHR
jgi:hypothetical protein